MTNNEFPSGQSMILDDFSADEISERIVDELILRSHAATYEYPGFVLITDADGTTWATGTANATWTIDHTTSDGSEILASFDTGVSCESGDLNVILDAIEKMLYDNGYSHLTDDSQ